MNNLNNKILLTISKNINNNKQYVRVHKAEYNNIYTKSNFIAPSAIPRNVIQIHIKMYIFIVFPII